MAHEELADPEVHLLIHGPDDEVSLLLSPEVRSRFWWALGIGFCLLLTACATNSEASAGDSGSPQQAVELTEEWVEAALDGKFDSARQLTYGEAGEPEGLNGLAETLFAYQSSYGQPVVGLNGNIEPSGHQVVCIRFDYGDFAIDGGMVLRDWPDQGLKLWEYRTGDSRCVDVDPAATTTLPEVPPAP